MTGLTAPTALLLSLSLCLSIAAIIWPSRVAAQEPRVTPHRASSHATTSRPHPARPVQKTSGKAKAAAKSRTAARRTAPKIDKGAGRHASTKHVAKKRTTPTARAARAPRATTARHRAPPQTARQAVRHASRSAPRISKPAVAAAALLGATAEARGPVQTQHRVATSHATAQGPTLLARCGYNAHAHRSLHTAAVYVRDVHSGKVLLAKNATRVRPIASLSKMMTAVVARDAQRPLSGKLTVTDADKDYLKYTHSRLKVGSTLSRADMFHIALMSSENRAAAALSRDYPGGRPAFMHAMNAKARALGMRHTHFENPTGLSPRNVSTAEDLARLVDYAAQDPLLRRYSTDKWDIVHPGHGELVYVNSNRLVRLAHWPVTLQKTGFINEAGHSMMMRMDVAGRPVTMVLLGSPTPQGDISDATRIRQWLDCSLQ